MRLNIDVSMDYQIFRDDPVLLTLEAAQTDGQTVMESTLEVENATLTRVSGEGIVGQRVWAHATGDRFRLRYRALVEVTRQVADITDLGATPMNALPGHVLAYLRPSRFCQSDLMTSFVMQRFGAYSGGAKIAAIVEWVGSQLSYVPGSSGANTSAIDTFVLREGVCRDFAHLVCSMARAANIPARYTSAYGIRVDPQDFHAVAEVWLDGAWHLVDATGMSVPAGLAVIASGRDASDVAFMETEQWAQMVYQSVSVTKADP